MKKFLFQIGFIALLCFVSFFILQNSFYKKPFIGISLSDGGRRLWMHQSMADPNSGRIPENIFQQSLSFSANLPAENEQMGKADFGIWVNRGPQNVGGRTRALAVDIANENRLIAGGVTGGIWKTEDMGKSWQKMSSDTDFTPVTCIAQDIRPGKTNTWYVGTGEVIGSANQVDYTVGNGIRKSTDNGKTWQRLMTTYSISPYNINAFSYVNRIAINPKIDSLDVVFAATQDGIFRSNDGGKLWSRRRGSAGGYSYFTDVAVDKNGIVYATLDGKGNHGGVWRSANNGQTWTNISPPWFNTDIGRIVMDIAPSDPNQIYFFAYSPGSGKKTDLNEWHSLWKYIYKSGDGSGSGGLWENRSNSLPADSTNSYYGTLSTQRGFCMYVKVKPDNPEVVFLGAVSLYVSTDGFKTTNHIRHIGGLKIGANDNYLHITIPNQHADEHDMVFANYNKNKVITASDGGIEFTNNVFADSIEWESMNHGYVTSQFYTVSMDHNSNSNILFGGSQDNGVRITNSSNYTKPWSIPTEGDGMGCYQGVGSDDYYFSCQQGWFARMKLDSQLNMVKMAFIFPKDIDESLCLWTTPYLIDESNRKRIYYANGPFLWRNNDITQIPFSNKYDSTRTNLGWEKITNTTTDSFITSFAYGKAQTDVIYYGTMSGKLIRLRDASTTNPIKENITGSNFPKAYLNCVTVDPHDSNSIFCVFSNFGILSVFYSKDGGTSWIPISGNLEQNANGTGIGPSCRWLTIANLPDTTLYFLGTSTGLYATGVLNGMNTIWTQQGPRSIGRNWVTMMDFRSSDNTMAVATYGAGIFTATLSAKDRTGLKEKLSADKIQLYPNPVSDYFVIDLPSPISDLSYEIYTTNGHKIKSGIYHQGNQIDVRNLPIGIYMIRLLSGKDKVIKKFLRQ